jgi:hypothetical protein
MPQTSYPFKHEKTELSRTQRAQDACIFYRYVFDTLAKEFDGTDISTDTIATIALEIWKNLK